MNQKTVSESRSTEIDNGRVGHPERIVVVGTNWVGDSIMSLPALREVRRLYSGSHLSLVVRAWAADIYQEQQLVDELICVPAELSLLDRTIFGVRALRGYDLAILFPNSFASALQTALAGIPDRIGYAADGRGGFLTERAWARTEQLKRHQIYHYLDLLYQTGLSPIDYLNQADFEPHIELRVPSSSKTTARALLKRKGGGRSPCVMLSPGAFFGPAKRWFPDRFASLADRIVERFEAEIVLVGSPGERDLAEYIQKTMASSAILLTGETELSELMGLFSICDLLITNDSGPMHLAAALDVPQIALFGSTNQVATGPFSRQARVFHKHVACSPCLLRNCPIDLRCFDRIQVSEVFDEACRLLC